ncbi:hypothetical protein BGK60_00460 [Tannerella forsythia]|nr:hypothetical protein BGK60_00460 [Tannerella forsythia]
MCEAHEALTFWLLLGQAKSDKKKILRFALNDKRPNAEVHPPSPLQRGEERSERGDVIPSKGECRADR